ncbi:MAG: CocE/NonD family hydrolase, partial [Gemmatimonadaceae bacterium]
MASLGLLSFLTIATAAGAQDSGPVKAHYAKTEYRVRMRDGTRLFTVVYAPRDTAREYAIMLARTPYSVAPYGADAYPRSLGPSPKFADEGFIFVYQDVRGRFMSEGEFVHMTPWRGTAGAKSVDESTDAYDTIDWLIKHVPHNNGRVGMWGTSYPGFFTAAALVNAHSALKAASPQAPQGDWFMGDDVHHHGAFLLASAFDFFATSGLARPNPTTEGPHRFDFGTDDGYAFFLKMGPLSNADKLYFKGRAPFWNDMMNHGTYDAFWRARNIAPKLRDIIPAVLTVGGWYDANNLHGALLVHHSIAEQSPATFNRIVVGPWSHGQWHVGPGDSLGQLRFGSNTGPFYRDSIEFPFFNHFLQNKGKLNLSAATMFDTGIDQWRKFDEWPSKKTSERAIYFHSDGKLSFTPPSGAEQATYDQYVSDPANPVPFLAEHSTGMKPDYMAEDQRFAAARPDVVVYTT